MLYFEFTKRLWGYLKTRFLSVNAIWFAIGVCLKLGNIAIATVLGGVVVREIDYHKIRTFADIDLVVAIFIGAIAFGGVHYIAAKNISFAGNRYTWGQSFLTRVVDEISSVATHFASVTFVYIVLFDQGDFLASLRLAAIFWVVGVFTFDAEGNVRDFNRPVKSEYKAAITNIKSDQAYPQMLPLVTGTLKKQPPPDSSVWVVRRFTENNPIYFPVEEIILPKAKSIQLGDIQWKRSSCYIGGRPGHNPPDERWLEVWLVGEEGTSIFRAWMDGKTRFESALNALPQRPDIYYPGLTVNTSDMLIISEPLGVQCQ